MQTHQLYAKASKCVFGMNEVAYLDRIISKNGVAVDQEEIKRILSWPTPTSLKALRGFLGMTGYYRKFIKGQGQIAAPLTALLKKNAWGWTQEIDKAFSNLKCTKTQAPLLSLPDFSQPFVIECNASGKRIGAVLMQYRRPIAFLGHALKGRNLTLSTYEVLLAIIIAIQKWRPYILYRRFSIQKDQMSLKFMLDQRTTTPLQEKQLVKLMA